MAIYVHICHIYAQYMYVPYGHVLSVLYHELLLSEYSRGLLLHLLDKKARAVAWRWLMFWSRCSTPIAVTAALDCQNCSCRFSYLEKRRWKTFQLDKTWLWLVPTCGRLRFWPPIWEWSVVLHGDQSGEHEARHRCRSSYRLWWCGLKDCNEVAYRRL